MNGAESNITVFRYSRFTQLMTDWALVVTLFGAFLGAVIMHRGDVQGGLIFTAVFCGLFGTGWIVGRLQLTEITIDERMISAIAFWGMVRYALEWKDIARVEYSTIADPLHRFAVPKSYVLMPKRSQADVCRKLKSIAFSVELKNSQLLLASIERQAEKYSFPIEEAPWHAKKPAKPAIS